MPSKRVSSVATVTKDDLQRPLHSSSSPLQYASSPGPRPTLLFLPKQYLRPSPVLILSTYNGMARMSWLGWLITINTKMMKCDLSMVTHPSTNWARCKIDWDQHATAVSNHYHCHHHHSFGLLVIRLLYHTKTMLYNGILAQKSPNIPNVTAADFRNMGCAMDWKQSYQWLHHMAPSGSTR